MFLAPQIENMQKRRQFLKIAFGCITGICYLPGLAFSAVQRVSLKAQKTILPNGAKPEGLIHKNPRRLYAGNDQITPLKDFRIMGLSDYEVQLDKWSLEVLGRVKSPLKLTYSQIVALPSLEKKVLLNCPGFFFNRGQWKGISMKPLLEKAAMEKCATHVTFSGPEGQYEKAAEFPIEHILSNRVFLAYGVNGKALPQKHGFPLRVVAASYVGDEWVKYVYKMKIR